jgi:cytochrome c peroxidase
VEEQAKGPVLNPIEMALASEAEAVAILRSIAGYAPLFRAAFPDEADPITFDNMALAIGAFERRLVTPSPLDAFMAGDLDALSPEQVRGLQAFLDVGCISRHAGPVVGGAMFQKLGLVHPDPTEELRRFKVTGNAADRFVFKIPSLRSIKETGPYFHDGSIESLDEAVRRMAHDQLGQEFTDAQVAEIVAFLGALTGQVDAAYVAPPELPSKAGVGTGD